MRQDKIENDAKKIVRKKPSRLSAVMRGERNRKSRGDSGTCSRICGVIWETPRIQKKDEPLGSNLYRQ